jgi:hypothetical protein
MKARHGAALLALVVWYLTLPPQARTQSSTLTLRQALLPLPNLINESADPAKFRPAPLNVVLHQYILLPGWMKANEFDDLRDWLTEQGFVTVMERSAGFPWCYSVFTDPLMPARFAPKKTGYIEGYSIGPDGSGVGSSCY